MLLSTTSQQDICVSRHGNNSESQIANAVNKSNRERQQEQILRMLLDNSDGLIEEEISTALGMRRHSASARIAELKAMGAIVKRIVNPSTGEYARRQTSSGSFAAVLIVNPALL